MNNISELFSDFTAKLLERSLMEFRQQDPEYQELDAYIAANQKQYETIMDSLGDEDHVFLLEYISNQIQRVQCTRSGMYLAGFKDCVKLLKHLGILH